METVNNKLPTLKQLHDDMIHNADIAAMDYDTINQLRRNVRILGVALEGLFKILMEKEHG